jgi:hypothetical protein
MKEYHAGACMHTHSDSVSDPKRKGCAGYHFTSVLTVATFLVMIVLTLDNLLDLKYANVAALL